MITYWTQHAIQRVHERHPNWDWSVPLHLFEQFARVAKLNTSFAVKSKGMKFVCVKKTRESLTVVTVV